MDAYISFIRSAVALFNRLGLHPFSIIIGTILSEPLSWTVTIYQNITCSRKKLQECGLNPVPIMNEKQEITAFLLIHGFLHNSSAWIDLGRVFQEENIAPVYTVDIAYGKESDLGKSVLENRMEEIKSYYPHHNVSFVLVGHSRGAQLATRIAIGGPIAEYSNEEWRKDIKQVIRIGNPLVDEETRRLGDNNLDLIFDIQGTRDVIIPPPAHSKPHPSELVSCGHLGLLHSSQAHRAIVNRLKKII